MPSIDQNKLSWLSFFRVGIAAVCLFNFLSLQLDFKLLFYKEAYSVPEISHLLSNTVIPSFYDISTWMNRYTNIDYNTILLVFRIIYPLSLVALLIGFYSRVTAILSLILFSIFVNSYNNLCYGFDTYANFSLFYCVIFPVGRFNAVSRRNTPVPTSNTNQYLYLLRAHIGVAYFFSGFEKLLGFNWRNGESIWKALHSINYTENINLDFLANTPFFTIIGWLTIILEMFYPVFMNIKQTRKIWLIGIIGLHVSIAVLMGLHFFSAILIIINLTCYYIPYLKEGKGKFEFFKFSFRRKLQRQPI